MSTPTKPRRASRARPTSRSLRRKGTGPLRKAGNYLVMIVITLVFVAPILYMVIGSFKPSDKVLNGLAGFIPEGPVAGQLHGCLRPVQQPGAPATSTTST